MSLKKPKFRNLRQGNHSVGDYVEEFSKLSRYAPGDVADDAAKQEKFLEGLNDDLGLQLTVATLTIIKSYSIRLSFWKASSSRWRIARGSTDRESTTLEFSRSPAIPRRWEIMDQDSASMVDTLTITMEEIFIMEEMDITIRAIGIAMRIEETTISISPIPLHRQRRI